MGGSPVSWYQTTFKASDSWYVDYIEGEVSLDQKSDMDLLLMHSSTEKKVVENLQKLKESVKSSDELDLPEDDQYWQSFHKKIMTTVEESSKVKWRDEKSDTKGRRARR